MNLPKINWGTGRGFTLYLKFMLYYTVTLAILAGILTYAGIMTCRTLAVDTEGAEKELIEGMYKNILLASVLLALFVLMTGLLFSRWITRPLRNLTVTASIVAKEGDLTRTVPVKSNNEVGQLASAFNQMIYNLGGLVKHIQDGGVQITTSSGDMLAASEEQASGSTEQATAVTEISATIKELATTSREIAASASSVAEVAEQTLNSAHSGQATIGDSIEGMDEIRAVTQEIALKISSLGQKSQAIGSIIETIDDIADRTDLLALNTAIEAARVGEAGKGFAVLAEQIRLLSDNVVEATRKIRTVLTEIQSSINGSVMAMEDGNQKVQRGVELANQVGGSFEEILGMIENITTSTKHIMHSTRQQESASGQVDIAMKEIAEVSQQSTVNARQTEATANTLSELSQELEKAIEQFKIAV
jgi:methyl-accepting chemotaxis protein